ncbi:2-phospho-L-lactate transferase [Paenarthrobacter ureafaciens]|uniref:2-phospho-L-lactate transferase n=1 Tax=Paenarthrobacter ureafaciens TaxID=37931 RepID=UPI001917615C|nr:2-phospho-L-lactate transferase [Paenarthrobacter ureafaciens]QQQ64401.1 2-phospho-L-lactate transferase [Paenarthrobacter ureafaciens]
MSIVCFGGGIGATRLWRALADDIGQESLTLVVNTADDLWHYGLRVCPDLDTVTYGLAGKQDQERGWGLLDESFAAMATLAELGEDVWFNLGDRDLATHLLRTQLLIRGVPLSEVTAHLAGANKVSTRILPMCEEEVSTEVFEKGAGWTTFQEYHVRHHAEPPVEEIRYRGIEVARTPPAVLEALETASLVVLGPSSPIASILPILSVGETRAAIQAAPVPVVAVTPIVSRAPINDPGDAHRAKLRGRLMAARGLEHTASAAASLYTDLVDFFVIDEADQEEATHIHALGMTPIVARTLTHVNPTCAPDLVHAVTSQMSIPSKPVKQLP